jgi:glutathione S-transferase
MIKLHGFSSSNYFNVPKLALLEKGVPFEEVVSYTGVGPK